MLRWTGQTVNPLLRWRRHCTLDARNCNPEKDAWVEALAASGTLPTMRILAVLLKEDALRTEHALIVRLRSKGVPVLNREPATDTEAFSGEGTSQVSGRA